MRNFSPQLFTPQYWGTPVILQELFTNPGSSLPEVWGSHHHSTSPQLCSPWRGAREMWHGARECCGAGCFCSALVCCAVCHPCSCQQWLDPHSTRLWCSWGKQLWRRGLGVKEERTGVLRSQWQAGADQGVSVPLSTHPRRILWICGPQVLACTLNRGRGSGTDQIEGVCSQLVVLGAPGWWGGTSKPGWWAFV